ncbi:FecR family protein [Labrenzia sp. 011]|uniref:FecR family protein n=1 Tax=Labrenzia sp. 011 TaxID=2171494 RepID=UPI000D50632F|nr:FecR family protein [Labrenzia sp. 011]PVB61123.1 iron dicitrate transport regulator FecR [Labrenzia sp. 011]
MSKIRMKTIVAATLFLAAACVQGNAQDMSGCVKTDVPDPPRIVYQCANGLVFEAEAAAEIAVEKSAAQARPDEVRLTEDAVLIEVEPDSGPFQILTPHAIAAVRGTLFVVDVTQEMTSVFVVRGQVAVSRPDGSDAVTLSAGEGVEVTQADPLITKRWPQEKADRLLARFAR